MSEKTWDRGDWLQTYTGVEFHPLDPRPEDIRIEDISHALSKLCRYGGHCIRFYSVAEHCVHVASKAPDSLKLVALMHDAAEAYIVDVPRPVKHLLPQYKAIEERLEAAIAVRFGLVWPFPEEIKRLDNAILADEREQNMGQPPRPWMARESLGVMLRFWPPQQAAYEFISLRSIDTVVDRDRIEILSASCHRRVARILGRWWREPVG
jgi:hypothetical protein